MRATYTRRTFAMFLTIGDQSTHVHACGPFPQQVAENDSVNRLRELVDSAGGRVVALTGAGMSTDSGIPDYRGPKGSYSRGHKPMTHDEFISSEANRKRYVVPVTTVVSILLFLLALTCTPPSSFVV